MREVYKETRVRDACYMVKSHIIWIQVSWQRKMLKKTNAVVNEAVLVMNKDNKTTKFYGTQHWKKSSAFGMGSNMEDSKGGVEKGGKKDKSAKTERATQ